MNHRPDLLALRVGKLHSWGIMLLCKRRQAKPSPGPVSITRTVDVGGHGSRNSSDTSVYLAAFPFLDLPLPLASTLPSAGLTFQAVKM